MSMLAMALVSAVPVANSFVPILPELKPRTLNGSWQDGISS